ncbi:transporter substrate-binding domain-containing protein, partial [Mycobacterium tuberculosis]|nr:transporter substrate-binding domain-containing protein [Mycobacterium tuberculosis]
MGYIIKSLAAGILALSFVPAAQAGTTLERVMQKKAMVVATNSSWPPQSYLDDNNEMVGFDIDMSKEIGKRLGVEVSFQTPDWAT